MINFVIKESGLGIRLTKEITWRVFTSIPM